MEKEPVILTKENAQEILYKQPYLAFLDILGFSTLVKKNTHDALVKLYDDIFSETVQRVDEMMKEMNESKAKKQGEEFIDSGLRIVNISDSIIIWTQHGNPNALFEIVFATSTLMGISLIRGLPLRGSITRQAFSVKENGTVTSVIGKGLVHAYNNEKIQQWAGCIVDTEIINYFRGIEKHIGNRERPAAIERENLVYEYDIPIIDKDKKPVSVKGYAVNWSEPFFTDEMIKESFDAHNKKDDSEGTTQKIQNTLEFHHFCQAKHKARVENMKNLQNAFDNIDNK